MSATFTLFAVALNLGAMALSIREVLHYRRMRKELSYGYWPHSSSLGSGARALHVAPPGERAGGTSAAKGTGAEPVSEEIIAERAWHLGQQPSGAPILRSCSAGTDWHGPTVLADETPTLKNSNGIYALRVLTPDYGGLAVIGTVALSGRVIEGERGYRAERATIRSLTLQFLPLRTLGSDSPNWPNALAVADELANRYQCDVAIAWKPQSELPARELAV